MVRCEKPHAPLSDESSANNISADVYFHNEAVRKYEASRFDALWAKLTGSLEDEGSGRKGVSSQHQGIGLLPARVLGWLRLKL